MTRLTTLEDIGLLPKAIEYAGETFMFNTWVTFKGKLCIGYKHVSTRSSFISIIVGDSMSYDTYIDILKVICLILKLVNIECLHLFEKPLKMLLIIA